MTSTGSESRFSRRSLLEGAGAAAAGVALGGGRLSRVAAAHAQWADHRQLINPLVLQRADAQIQRYANGLYYMTGSVPGYDRLVVRASPTLAGLATADETVIWRRPTSGPLGGHIWAPGSITSTGGGTATSPPATQTTSSTSAPTSSRARGGTRGSRGGARRSSSSPRGHVHAGLHDLRAPHGTRYLAWAQHEPRIDTNSNLYIARLASPTELATAPARIAVPMLPVGDAAAPPA